MADETGKGEFPKEESGKKDSIILELWHILWDILHSHIRDSLELSNRNTLETEASNEGRLCAGIIYIYIYIWNRIQAAAKCTVPILAKVKIISPTGETHQG